MNQWPRAKEKAGKQNLTDVCFSIDKQTPYVYFTLKSSTGATARLRESWSRRLAMLFLPFEASRQEENTMYQCARFASFPKFSFSTRRNWFRSFEHRELSTKLASQR